MSIDYDELQAKQYISKTRELLKELPSCCATFLRGAQNSERTRYAYAVDLKTFFTFLKDEIDGFKDKPVTEINLSDLETVKALDIELFLEHLSLYTKNDREIVNREKAKARKLATLRSFFKYFFKHEMISKNVAALVSIPKLHEHAIIRLEPREIVELLNTAEDGTGLSSSQKKYHGFTKKRDLAILTLFLGTGIRISELVGIDMDDLDFSNNSFSVTRKGGYRDVLIFGAEVRSALLDYMLEREVIHALPGHEKAFFLSMQKKRLTVRAIENLVKKYAKIAAPLKNISPHKLRSTFGTSLYRETGDIYLVADVLGHKDVNTTRKHYSATDIDNRHLVAEALTLRSEYDSRGEKEE